MGAQNLDYGCRTVDAVNLPNFVDPTTNPTQQGGSQIVETTYTYRQKPWSFRAGVALRFRLVPE